MLMPAHASTLSDLKIPAKHPYLFFNASSATTAKANIAKYPWARKVADDLMVEVNQIVKEPVVLPAKGDIEHQRLARKAEILAVAYLLTDDKKYADKSAEIILKYADEYLNYPLENLRGRVMWGESSQEALWFYRLVLAYDEIVDSGVFTPQQKKHVEDDLMRPAVKIFKIDDYSTDPRATDMHYHCYLRQTFHNFCVGIAGLCIRDNEMISYAFDGPFGFKHLIGHDLRDDGILWERSLSYQSFGVLPAGVLAEAAYHCGIDLYHMEVPDIIKDDGLNYMVNGDNGPKTLKMMFDAPFYFAFPDKSGADIADSLRNPLFENWKYMLGYQRYHDAKYAWALKGREGANDYRSLFFEQLDLTKGEFHLQGQTGFASNGVVQEDSTLFPSSGFAVLRQPTTDKNGWPDINSLALNFNCGPFGGAHGHPDKLSIVLYANQRQWLPDFGSFDYDSPLKAKWTAQTVSHNTVVVDQVTQYPCGLTDETWVADSPEKKAIGKIDLFHADPITSITSGWTDSVYEGISMRRTLVHLGQGILDIYSLKSSQPHVYDYVLHVDGQFADSSVALSPQAGKIGDKCGYQFIDNIKHGLSDQLLETTWKQESTATRLQHTPNPYENHPRATTQSADADHPSAENNTSTQGDTLRIITLPVNGTEVFVGDSITNTEKTAPMLLLRRKAAETTFVTFMLPFKEPTFREMDDKSLVIGSDAKKNTSRIFISPVENVFQGELGIVSRSEAAAAMGIPFVATLVNGTKLQFQNMDVTASQPMTLFVVYRNKHWIVTPGPNASGKLTIGAHTFNVKPGDKQYDIPEDASPVR